MTAKKDGEKQGIARTTEKRALEGIITLLPILTTPAIVRTKVTSRENRGEPNTQKGQANKSTTVVTRGRLQRRVILREIAPK